MALSIFAVGVLRGPYRALADDYLDRLRPRLPVTVREFRALDALRRALARTPARRILLDERGDSFDTRGFHRFVSEQVRARGGAVFCLGGSDGFEDRDRHDAHAIVSLSRLTLPHRLARIVLLEQLYRVSTIEAGHPYHRDG